MRRRRSRRRRRQPTRPDDWPPDSGQGRREAGPLSEPLALVSTVHGQPPEQRGGKLGVSRQPSDDVCRKLSQGNAERGQRVVPRDQGRSGSDGHVGGCDPPPRVLPRPFAQVGVEFESAAGEGRSIVVHGERLDHVLRRLHPGHSPSHPRATEVLYLSRLLNRCAALARRPRGTVVSSRAETKTC